MFCSINLLFDEVLAAVAIVFCERSLITSMNKRTILIIKLNPPLKPGFFVLTLMLAFCAATSEKQIPLRYSTS